MNNIFRLTLLIAVVIFSSACTEEKVAAVDHSEGKAIYTKNCKVCHAQGINGAPIYGNQKMWKDRASQPIATLVEHASNGFGLMPAKGGNESLNDQQIEQAIGYMLEALEK